ncbi:MAG: tyrosine-type recombinase/integrase [Acidimicrobiales bacterium]
MSSKRHFGTVRRRSSGRWQAIYDRDGVTHSAGTFNSKADALACLAAIETDLRRGAWIDPKLGRSTVAEFCNEWLDQRTDLAYRTAELYRYLLDQHILPALGRSSLVALSSPMVRSWHASVAKKHPSTAAKAYRLLSSIMRTAVVDGLIVSSPCKVDGGGVERAVERPIATVSEIDALEAAMPEHLRLIVPLATWCQLRRAEILGLRRKDVDLRTGVIRIEQSRTITMHGKSLTKEPKSFAGRRTIALPTFLVCRVREHLDRFGGPDDDSLVFRGVTGIPLTGNVLQMAWQRSRAQVGRTDLRLHDLRHTGLTLAAATGATTVELMHRAGHSSSAAAMRYQHATKDRDRILADALGALVEAASRDAP